MPDLTEKEYDELDELWTHNPPKVSTKIIGELVREKIAAGE